MSFGRLRLDFGVERAGWFEFFSPDLSSASLIKASISEYNEPWPGKTLTVKAYDGNLFRLETNDELYEGVRFAWIIYEPQGSPSDAPVSWTITQARIVAQVKPVNYTGSFTSAESTLTAVWHAGALGSRLNMHEQYFGSILMDRGDRVSIQGDGHPTMAAALAAFASPEVHRLVKVMLNATDSGCKGCHVVDDGIMSYPVLWTMSVHDWLWSSGEKNAFLTEFADDVASILTRDFESFLTNPFISLQGWDDRLGNGWCFPPSTAPCGREPQLTFAAQLVMAVQEFSSALLVAGDPARASNYTSMAKNMTSRLMAAFNFDDGTLGVHSASMMLNVANLASPAQAMQLISTYLNDSTSICSWSPFNSYWILQGLGAAGALDRASEMAALCWGGMTRMAPGCFWELFEPGWESLVEPGGKAPTRPSYCHPWANGVTAWISRALGGINPVEPGYTGLRGYVATPHISHLFPHTSASTTTPSGVLISLRADYHRLDNGTMRRSISLDAPFTPGVVGLPESGSDEIPNGCQLHHLLVNGVEVRPVALGFEELGGALRFRAALPRTHLFSPLLAPGTHNVVGEYVCTSTSAEKEVAASPIFPPVTWRALGWDLDYSTRGNWLQKRGLDGYFLFSFDTNATGYPLNVASLPSYAMSVSPLLVGFESVGYTSLGVNNTDPAFLSDPRDPSTKKLGLASTGGDGSQGVAINVNMTYTPGQRTNHKISFYMASTHQPTTAVDPYQNGNPSMVLRVMDLIDLNPIAPDVRVDDYNQGVWYSVTICCGCPRAGFSDSPWCGVRARMMQIDGTNTISAVVFDTV